MTATGQAALIAGAANPATRPIAVALAEQGLDVALCTNISGDAALFSMNSTANELWALDRRHLVIPAGGGLADPVAQARTEFDRLDLLITLPEGDAKDSDDAMLAYLRDRLGGVLLLCASAAAVMREGEAAILNCVANGGNPASPVSAAAEAGVEAASLAMAGQLRARVAVNAARVSAATDPRQIAALALELLGSQLSRQVFEL